MNPQSIRWHWLQVALVVVLTALITPMSIAWTHEIRPAYLQIDEIGLGRYQLLWRTPVFSGMRLPVVLRLPDELHQITAPTVREPRIHWSSAASSTPGPGDWLGIALSSWGYRQQLRTC